MGLARAQPIHDVTKAAPTKRSINSSGIVVIEKLPQNRNRRLFMKPCGSIVWVVLSTNPAIRKPNPYGAQIQAEKIENGFLPMDECPVLKGHLKAADFTPTDICKGTDGRGALDPENPCPCLIGILEKRREAHLTIEAEYADRLKSSDTIMRDFVKSKMFDETPKAKAEKIVRKPRSTS